MMRDEKTLETIGLPENNVRGDLSDRIEQIIILESMFATGGSAISAIEEVRKVHPEVPISVYAIFGAPEGILKFEEEYRNSKMKDIKTYIAQLDERLTDTGFIFPGIGDAGDMAYEAKKNALGELQNQWVLSATGELIPIDYDPLRMLEATLGRRI